MGGDVFCVLPHYFIFIFFTVFLWRSIPAMAKVTFGLALSITVADKVDVSLMTTSWDVAAYAGTQIVIGLSLYKNCRNAVEHIQKWPVIY